MNVIVSDVAFH